MKNLIYENKIHIQRLIYKPVPVYKFEIPAWKTFSNKNALIAQQTSAPLIFYINIYLVRISSAALFLFILSCRVKSLTYRSWAGSRNRLRVRQPLLESSTFPKSLYNACTRRECPQRVCSSVELCRVLFYFLAWSQIVVDIIYRNIFK